MNAERKRATAWPVPGSHPAAYLVRLAKMVVLHNHWYKLAPPPKAGLEANRTANAPGHPPFTNATEPFPGRGLLFQPLTMKQLLQSKFENTLFRKLDCS